MIWNYRVLKKEYEEEEDIFYQVVEVYYDENSSPVAYTERNPLDQDSKEAMIWVLCEIEKAYNQNILILKGDKLIEINEKIRFKI